MANAHFMLDIQGYKYTLRVLNAYCFSTATMVERTRLNVTLHVHCLSCQHCVTYSVIRNDCRGFNNLPPPSPDATPCDFFLWGYVKDQVYVLPLPTSIPELKVRIRTATEPSPLTCYKQFGTNSIIVLMFVESQRVHIQSTCKVCNKTWSVVLLNKKKHIYSYLKCIVYDKLLKPRQSF